MLLTVRYAQLPNYKDESESVPDNVFFCNKVLQFCFIRGFSGIFFLLKNIFVARHIFFSFRKGVV